MREMHTYQMGGNSDENVLCWKVGCPNCDNVWFVPANEGDSTYPFFGG